MGEQLPPLNACYNTSNFENASYQDMLNMVSGVNPAAIMARGTALVDAQAEIDKIGTELKEHVGRTTGWKGAGGDAFREWGDGFAKETLKLADYAGSAGTAMQTAGQALSEVAKVVQGHPDAVQMCYADEAKEKARLKAVETARNEAIPQMNKLASYYLMAQQTISSQEEPNFKPLPSAAVPDSPVDTWQTGLGPGGSNSGTTDSVAGTPSGNTSRADHQYSTVSPDGVTPSSPAGTPAVHTPQHVSAVWGGGVRGPGHHGDEHRHGDDAADLDARHGPAHRWAPAAGPEWRRASDASSVRGDAHAYGTVRPRAHLSHRARRGQGWCGERPASVGHS